MDKRDIIGQIGEFSFYQRVIALTILFAKIPAALSMMMMAFGGSIPDWTCIENGVINYNLTNLCSVNGSQCNRIYLTEWKNIINEWDLVCEKRWIGFAITSVQMAGVLLGSIITGYSSDTFGRKSSFFASQLCLLVFNTITIFSTSWQMFAVLRFFIGVAIGGITTVSFPLAMEFVGPKWRGILGAIPAFSLGATIIPLFLWLVPDWKYFQVFNSVLCVIPLIGWFYVPESIRWLTVSGKIEEAEKVIQHIAKKNNAIPPNTDILHIIYEEEKANREKRKDYSYLDLVRTKDMAKRTAICCIAWMSQSAAFYCIALGVQNLSGNLFLNMFLLTVVEMPSHLIVLFSANTIGRRWAVAGFYYAAGLLTLIAALVSVYGASDYKGSVINGCAMVANLCVGTSWTVMMVFTTEQYPTVVRNLGYAASNTMARVGAIFSAQLISLGGVDIYLPYAVITVLMAVSGCLILLLKETKGTVLVDLLVQKEKANKFKKTDQE